MTDIDELIKKYEDINYSIKMYNTKEFIQDLKQLKEEQKEVEIDKNWFYEYDWVDILPCPNCDMWAIYEHTKYCPLCWAKIKRID